MSSIILIAKPLNNQAHFSAKHCFFYLLLFIICSYSSNLSAKEACKKYANRLDKIQIAQRSGHSLKQSNRLNQQERLIREKWWQCKNSSQRIKKTTKKTAKKQNKKRTKKIKTRYSASLSKVANPFKTSQAIVITEKYQGEKKFAWLKYYQQPQKCRRPKNLAVFAVCSEDKQHQRQVFEQNYQTNSG